MIWITLFIIIIATSAYLAYRSMRNYQEIPHPDAGYSLFLIRNKEQFNQDILNKLHSLAQSSETFFSVERLYKGTQNALLIYGPKFILNTKLPLDLLELEDYLYGDSGSDDFSDMQKKISKDMSYAFSVEPKNNPKKHLSVKNGFLKLLEINPQQYFFWQVVCYPLKANSNPFQVTIRGMVADQDLHQRVELVKKMTTHIQEFTGLLSDNKNQTSSVVFDAFIKRALIPKEVSSFVLDSDEVLNLLSLPG